METVTLTITEALAEIRTITRRLDKKRDGLKPHLYRQDQMRDPLEASGGSVEWLKRERQAIADLEDRLVVIRTAIQDTNRETSLTLRGDTRSVAEWLIWRREVAPNRQRQVREILQALVQVRDQAKRQGLGIRSAKDGDGGGTAVGDVIVHVDEAELAAEAEKLEEVLGTLDGQLSLLNATTSVTVPQ